MKRSSHPRVARRRATFDAGRPSRDVLLRALREAYAGPAWHGPSLRAALRGISATTASEHPGPGRPSCWEIVLHLAYTRHRLLHRLGVSAGERFPRRLRAAWWPRMPWPEECTPAAWRADLALLDAYHERLVAVVATVPESRLRAVRAGQPRTIAHELLGVALHDAYHTGQIRLGARLLESGRDS